MAAQQVWMAGRAQDQGRETRALQNWEGVVQATYAQDQCRLKNNGKQPRRLFPMEEGRHGFLQSHTTPL